MPISGIYIIEKKNPVSINADSALAEIHSLGEFCVLRSKSNY